MNVTLKIEKKGEQYGTVGWLAANAAAIRLAPCRPMFTGDQRLGAWLIGHDGKTLAFLADSTGHRASYEAGFSTEWTPAAQQTMVGLQDIALGLLEEDDGCATFTVTRT